MSPDIGTNYWGRYSYVKGTSELEKENELEGFKGYIDGYLHDNPARGGFASGVIWILNNDKVVRKISDNVLYLMDGYEIRIKAIEGDKVYVELSLDGSVVDSKVIRPSKTGATLADQTYYYKNCEKNLITIALHFKDSTTVDAYWHIGHTQLCLVLWPGEGQLADLINKYRKDNGLGSIPITISMQKVARAHVKDLEEFHPDDRYCKNFVSSDHSWSNHGV